MKKRYIIILVILAAGSALTIWKWNTWFRNPPEEAYLTPATPDRIILTLGEDAENTSRITWRCDTVLTDAYIEFTRENTIDTLKIAATGDIISSRAGKSAFYKAELQKLSPGSTYHYRVVNPPMASGWYSFRLPSSDTTLSFIYSGDIQDNIEGTTGEMFNHIRQQNPDVDFWAFSGDVIERPTDAYWTHWYTSMDSIAGTIPIVASTGNHEYLKGAIKTLDPRWIHSFSNPENGPKDFIGRSYFLNFKDLCYIVIDTDGIQGPVSLYRHYAWLKEVLSTTTKKWKIVMMHHPVYSVRNGRNNFYVRYTFKPLLEKYDVNLALQGHDHGYSRITTKNSDGEKQCPVYIVSSSSPKSYNIGVDPIHDRLGSNLMLYQRITIKGDSLRFQAFTPEDTVYDDFTIINTGKPSKVADHAEHLPEHLELPPAYRNGKVNIEEYNQKIQEREKNKNSHDN